MQPTDRACPRLNAAVENKMKPRHGRTCLGLSASIVLLLTLSNTEYARVLVYREYLFKAYRFTCTKCDAVLTDSDKSGATVSNDVPEPYRHHHDWIPIKKWFKYWMWSDYLLNPKWNRTGTF